MKLSIIVPVYKVEPYLHRCVNSILAQTFRDFEVILVDDGSPDNCGAICDEYAVKDVRVKVIHKTNGGLSDARNAGLDIVQGDYIGFVDSDDYIHPKMYELLVKIMETCDVEMAQCAYKDVCPDGEVDFQIVEEENPQIIEAKEILQEFYPRYWHMFPGLVWRRIYKREVFKTIRFPTGMVFEDIYILIPTIEKCTSVAIIDTPLYYYAMNPDSIMRKTMTRKNLCDHMMVYHKHLVFFKSKGNIVQYNRAQEALCSIFVIYYFHHHFSKRIEGFGTELRRMLKQYPTMVRNPEICKMKKICLLSILLSKHLALKLFLKYFPEYVPSCLRLATRSNA